MPSTTRRTTPRRLTAVALLVGGLVACKEPLRCPRGGGLLSTNLRGESLPPGAIALTFDDGPGPHTERLLDALGKAKIRATFFVIGQNARRYPRLLARMKAEGHLVGNHSDSHADLTRAPDPVGEVKRTDELIRPHVPGDVFLFRAPYGAFDTSLTGRLNGAGLGRYLGPIHWDIGDSGSGRYISDTECRTQRKSATECATIYKAEIGAKKRGIVLLHDLFPESVDVAIELISSLPAAGYRFVRVDEIPDIAAKLRTYGARPGTIGGPAGCTK